MGRTWTGILPAALAAWVGGGAWTACRAADEPTAPAPPSGPPGVVRRAAPQSEPWKRLFDGTDLAGWHAHGGGSWKAIDGEIAGEFDAGGGGWLLTDEEYANFDLRLAFKVRKGGSSGVCIRFPKDPAKRRGGSDDPALGGYEVRICGVPRALNPTGSIRDMARAYALEYTRESAPYWKDDDWNALQITARFEHLRVKLNGRVVADLFDRGSLRGMIGLRVEEKETPV
ncbi:MAG: DUF1080 domain-containing protein, partial [Planctomycetes bacterium]|nr:DUF1080 domain-containing protein [Planctomycetota bacterium]